jgi:hypothetical protein
MMYDCTKKKDDRAQDAFRIGILIIACILPALWQWYYAPVGASFPIALIVCSFVISCGIFAAAGFGAKYENTGLTVIIVVVVFLIGSATTKQYNTQPDPSKPVTATTKQSKQP